MAHEEVGRSPELDAQAERIYVLPGMEQEPEDDFRILVIADGNNRAQLEHKSYDDGGRNVIDIAEALAVREDVSLMAACILSPENIQKRSPAFKEKIAEAFQLLSARMDTRGTLLDAGVRMSTYGDTESLRTTSPTDAKLVDIVERTREKTVGICDEKLELCLGLNYDEDMAINTRVDGIYRTGSDVFRTSGLRVHPGILNYSTHTLWPNVKASDIFAVIDDIKKRLAFRQRIGYSPEAIIQMLHFFEMLSDADIPSTITIPYQVAEKDLRAALQYHFEEVPGQSFHIQVHHPQGHVSCEFGRADVSGIVMHLIHGAHVPAYHAYQSIQTKDHYSHFLAPGQMEGAMIIPSEPHIGYANVHPCPSTPAEIVETVRNALKYSRSNAALKGAERVLDTSLADPELDSYNAAADAFVEELFDWAESTGLALRNEHQRTAVQNYFLTCYFLTNYPSHPDWEQLGADWKYSGTWLARYMGLVYHTDEDVFDKEVPGETPEQRLQRLRHNAAYYQYAMTDGLEGSGNPSPQATDIEKVTAGWRGFLDHFQSKTDPATISLWHKAMVKFADSSVKEWEPGITDNSFVRLLSTQPHKARELLEEQFIQHMPGFMKQKMYESLDAYATADEEEQKQAAENLNLLLYLFQIEASMGAGQAYFTLALTMPPEEMNEEVRKLLFDIGVLSNCYFRILNDFAGTMRSANDQEMKADSYAIARRWAAHEENPEEAALKYVLQKASAFQEEILRSTEKLHTLCPRLAIPMKRAVIAKDIYKRGHYRTLTRDDMSQIFRERFNVGIDT